MKSSNFDMNKIMVIMELVDDALKKSDSYRFACNLTGPERTMLEEYYKIEVVKEFEETVLYCLTKK